MVFLAVPAVFPLLLPILIALLLRLWRKRGGFAIRTFPVASGLLVASSLLIAGSDSVELALWQPTELYGEGMLLRLDAAVLPYALLAAAILAARDRVHELELLHFSAVLTAIVAGNLLALVISWSVLAGWSNWRARNVWHLAAVAPLYVAAAVAGDPLQRLAAGPFLALAAVLRGRGARRPYLTALPALAVLARSLDGGPLLVLLGASAIVVGTLGGKRWLAPGLLGLATITAGVSPALAPAAALACAITLVIAGSVDWAAPTLRIAIAGAAVGSLPLQIALLAGSAGVPLLLVPAAALLAAPVLSGVGLRRDRPAPAGADRIVAALPMAVAIGVLVYFTERLVLSAALHAVGAIGLGALMAAGPRWLYRQPAYTRLAENLLSTISGWAAALLRGLSTAVRGLNAVLEGEASTVWLFLILLIVAQGLAG